MKFALVGLRCGSAAAKPWWGGDFWGLDWTTLWDEHEAIDAAVATPLSGRRQSNDLLSRPSGPLRIDHVSQLVARHFQRPHWEGAVYLSEWDSVDPNKEYSRAKEPATTTSTTPIRPS